MTVESAPMSTNFKQQVASAVGWSALQSWSIKFLAILLFFVLARLLTATELGLAQTVMLLLAFIGVVSEQGFHRALVQRADLRAVDANLPFFISIGIALVAALIMWLGADAIAMQLGEPKTAGLLRMAAVIPPVTAATGVMVAMLRRTMDFRSIAQAALAASVISGIVALILALQGFGALSLVTQAIVSVLVTALMIWCRPGWRPRWHFDLTHLRGIMSYSTMSFASQLVEFFSRRLIDVIILNRYGLAALGIYTIGAKLYQTALELLTATLMEVTLSAFSRLVNEAQRFRHAYLRLVFIASCTSLPVFLLMSALAPELCAILFGNKWAEAAIVTQILCVLGAVEVVQLLNLSVLAAAGKARAVLLINVAKLVIGAIAIIAIQGGSVALLSAAFVISQIIVFPFSVRAAMQVTGSGYREVIAQILPGLLAASLASAVVFGLRTLGNFDIANNVLRAAFLAMAYAAVLIAVLALLCRQKIVHELRHIVSSYKQ